VARIASRNRLESRMERKHCQAIFDQRFCSAAIAVLRRAR
jgi:hypothetical protein